MNLNDVRKENDRKIREAVQKNTWDSFMAKHPDCNCTANRQMLSEFCNGEITDKNLLEAYDYLSSQGQLARVGSEQLEQQRQKEQEKAEREDLAAREAYIATILNQRMSEESRLALEKQLRWKSPVSPFEFGVSTERLRQRAEEVQQKKDLRSLTTQELREQIRNDQAARSGIPNLPEKYSRKELKSMPPAALRLLCQRYGIVQINTRLAQPVEGE